MTSKKQIQPWLLHASAAAAMAFCTVAAQAQPSAVSVTASTTANPFGLRHVFDTAWARQPEALALGARRDAARALQQTANAWTPEPAALGLALTTDRLSGNEGARELEVAMAVPLWLPGERSRSAALANAESAALESRASAAQLRLAATVREAWWQWQRARMEVTTVRDQLDNTRRLAADVARRKQAGDLTLADQYQAEGAVANAEAGLAQAAADLMAARQLLRALGGAVPAAAESVDALPEPEPNAALADLETHAALQELRDRAAVADRTVALSATQSRGNPELQVTTARGRGAFGEAAKQNITVGLSIPFGGGPRYEARAAGARAEAAEVQAQLALERERLVSEREAARARVEGARLQLEATERRARLARDSRGFFEKSFRLGETDLPTRLRIEAEAAEAERQAARTRIELAAAISAHRQALGLLPQ